MIYDYELMVTRDFRTAGLYQDVFDGHDGEMMLRLPFLGFFSKKNTIFVRFLEHQKICSRTKWVSLEGNGLSAI